MKRREFLSQSALASGAMMVPKFLSGTRLGKLMSSRSGKTLIVIQLSGGNDGLNTVIPYQNDLYYKARPNIAIPSKKVLGLDGSELGLHPVLHSLKDLYGNGELSIINNVGYPNPNRSHFRSMDIWQTASNSQQYLSTGWLGRYLDHHCEGRPAYEAVNLEAKLNLALKGNIKHGFAISEMENLKWTEDNPYQKNIAKAHPKHHEHEDVAYLYKTIVETQDSAQYLLGKSKTHRSSAIYPDHPFGEQLKQISQLMTADADIKIYYANLSGFDTHAYQMGTQEGLLKIYADSIRAFIKDLKRNGLFDDSLIMTFSEFGRRVEENGSHGTDHGTANNIFLMGGKLKKPGIFNSSPDLVNLDDGDLKYQIDFRQVYADIIQSWFGGNATEVLGGKFPVLGII